MSFSEYWRAKNMDRELLILFLETMADLAGCGAYSNEEVAKLIRAKARSLKQRDSSDKKERK